VTAGEGLNAAQPDEQGAGVFGGNKVKKIVILRIS